MILTKSGLKEIERISVGDKVLSANVNTGEVEYKDVTKLFSNKHQNLLILLLTMKQLLQQLNTHFM